MPLVDFYILQDTASEARWQFACRLIEKAFRQGHRINVALEDDADATAFNDLLWTFKPESFIPHQQVDSSLAWPAPVMIMGSTYRDIAPNSTPSLLINLSTRLPTQAMAFDRVSEIVIQDPEVLAQTRARYSFYRQQQCAIEHRKI